MNAPESTRAKRLAAALATAAIGIGLLLVFRDANPEIIDLSFESTPGKRTPDEQTLASIRKMGRLYLVTSYGDYEERLEWLDKRVEEKASELAGRRKCSVFVTPAASGHQLLGRNFDRLDKNPILVKTLPPGKYASFAFCPEEVAEHLRNMLAAGPRASSELKSKFLWSLPFYPVDGINEKGLALAIAAAPARRVRPVAGSTPAFVLLFIRRALDTCRNIDEVERLAETLSLYDRNRDTISHHFLAADADGNWLVIDCPDGAPRFVRGRGKPQARTNHFLEGGPSNSDTRTSFSRYETLSEALCGTKPPKNIHDAMALLRRVKDKTAWSVVYDSNLRGGLVSVAEHYRTQYRFGFSADERP